MLRSMHRRWRQTHSCHASFLGCVFFCTASSLLIATSRLVLACFWTRRMCQPLCLTLETFWLDWLLAGRPYKLSRALVHSARDIGRPIPVVSNPVPFLRATVTHWQSRHRTVIVHTLAPLASFGVYCWVLPTVKFIHCPPR